MESKTMGLSSGEDDDDKNDNDDDGLRQCDD